MDTARGDNTNTDAPATMPPPPDITLTVSCGHGETTRKVLATLPPMTGTLQVVPNHNPTTLATSVTLLGVVQFQVQASGHGDDTIVASLDDANGAAIPNPQLAIIQGDAPADSDWQSGTVLRKTIPTPGDNSIVWLGGASPTAYNVFGRGNPGDNPLQARVEAFPCYAIQGTASIQQAANVVKDVTDKLNSILEPIGQAISAKVEMTILPPTGTIQVTTGWQENSDNKTYYGWEALVGLNPLVGASLKFSSNLAALAAGACGVPPSLTQYAGGIVVAIEFGGQVGVSGRAARTGPGPLEMGVSASGQIWAQLSIAAVVGNPDVVSAQVVGASKTSFTLTINFSEQSGKGLVMNPSITWNGLVVSVSVVTNAYKKEMSNNQLCAWTLFDPWNPPWTPKDPWVLISSK